MKHATRIGLSVVLLLLTPVISNAASNTCEIVEVDESRLVLECERDNSALEPGTKVKLKTIKKRSAPVEGC